MYAEIQIENHKNAFVELMNLESTHIIRSLDAILSSHITLHFILYMDIKTHFEACEGRLLLVLLVYPLLLGCCKNAGTRRTDSHNNNCIPPQLRLCPAQP